ncbi:UbiA family prenyltransferase [Niabella yanshanensis]|uniref:UbiA family prenyltransferase n=1 Tax=Niabella yanshanensis TaxID=577386 RepID=A0ABZ0W7Z3_9BACT|nr:UbiA family prenyltransferase [Niabella yanshanensis]WQD37652.1 UbiA family prenyltransferase [Niabella yanshanensis]
MLHKSTIQHLRFGFSLFLMPVFWFALSQAPVINWVNACLIFIILHLLVYPSSNGYNSYMDKDTGSIGGIEKPLPVHKELFYVSMVMDIIALLLSCLLGWAVLTGVGVYIIASRLYSYRGVRLKQYPVTGYLTVIICQGALVYFIVSNSVSDACLWKEGWLPAMVTSLLIGGTYPLTQVYQHQQDLEDGVITLSYKLGVRGTFIFCGLVLFVALLLLTLYFIRTGQWGALLAYGVGMLPVGFYFTSWCLKVKESPGNANFKNLMKMNYVASVCSSIAFISILIINKAG